MGLFIEDRKKRKIYVRTFLDVSWFIVFSLLFLFVLWKYLNNLYNIINKHICLDFTLDLCLSLFRILPIYRVRDRSRERSRMRSTPTRNDWTRWRVVGRTWFLTNTTHLQRFRGELRNFSTSGLSSCKKWRRKVKLGIIM